jgi:hypothetical protein
MNNKRYKDLQGNVHLLWQGEPDPTWVEVEVDPNQLPDPNFVPPYTARRHNSYPDVKQQLDMLWHEISNNGSISTEGEWFNAIKEVKETHPKS